ncbi:hypothetical protein [Nocardioides sp. InS609-2]|uniref:hypothetical protein n=1 Tax=Nocardioides sp. InS609-2 TaxID=2760705 RepID=UPI0020C0AD91|nr:hypothetical protein [Nocardioides sp. InS609-2]
MTEITTPDDVLVVTASSGIDFGVRVVEAGATYGLFRLFEADRALVEFYDRRYPHTEHGQFVSRYELDTLLGNHRLWSVPPAPGQGLTLHGGVPDWVIDGATMDRVYAWLRGHAPAAPEVSAA